MTDKEQIIIDGVDVSECRFHQIEANELYPKAHYCGSIKNTFCENKPNCYFKQLARKTQECEELKKQLIQKDEVNTFFNTPVEGWSSDPCNICECKNNYDHYRKALEEIEGIVTKDHYDNNWADIAIKIDSIRSIINKVKGEGHEQ